MNDKFLKLDSEKRTRILKAICEEFAEHSYKDVSTNRIVKRAGISKGSLFNYFDSKESLYHNLLDYGLQYFTERNSVAFETNDFIERCKLLAEVDMRIYMESPYLTECFARLYLNDMSALPEVIKDKVENALTQTLGKLYEGIDYSLFRTDIPIEEILKMIQYIIDGYMKELIARMDVTKFSEEIFLSYLDEFNNFLISLKKVFYT